MSIEYLCSCGRTYRRYNSLQRKCPICYYNVEKKPRKALKKLSKVSKEWFEFRNEYLDNHPEPYYCIVGGGKMDRKHVTLDHDIPRSKRPDLRLDDTNINTMCGFHNRDKSSRTLDDYLKTDPDKNCRNF